MKVEIITKRRFMCAEGPYWDDKEKLLWHVDVHGKAVCRLNPVTQETEYQILDGYVTMLVPYSSDPKKLLLTETARLLVKNWKEDKKEYLAEIDGSDLRLNDGKCDASGRLWTGSMGIEGSPSYLAVDPAALYSYEEGSGQFKTHLRNVGLSNGLGWTRDNRVMFFVDSLANNVRAFDFDIHHGEISNGRVLHTFSEYQCLPDGMCTDAEDKLWVALYGANKIIRIDPETGVQIGVVELPAANITSCCFGGPNYETLFVTSSSLGIEKGTSETAGAVFQVTGLGVKGLPPNNFGSKE